MRSSSITRRQVVVSAAACSLLAGGLTPAAFAGRQASPPAVVATFSILGDWAQRVARDRLAVTTIVPAGGDTHTFDPSPDQVGAIADADLVFEIGLEFETWLDGMAQAAGGNAGRVVVSDGVEVLHFGEDDHDHDHEADGHDHGSDDPHIWGDVRNAMIAVEAIQQALMATDPDHAATYEDNATAYLAELATLDEAIRTATATIPEERRQLVTTHDTLGYYAHAYGFTIPGTALGSISTDGGDPSARDIAALVNSIQEAGVPAIFADTVTSNALMETIAAEAGVNLAPPLYTDALGEPGSPGATYIDLMEYNTGTIVAALT